MPKTARTTAPRADLGPSIRRERGEVVVEFRPDPDNPQRATVKGARAAQGGHDYLRARGSLDAAQHAAAERYSAAYHGQAKSGCHLAAAMDGNVRVPPHQQGHPSADMLDCAEMIRRADYILGEGMTHIVRLVVIKGSALKIAGEAAGETDQIALGRLRGALDRLAEMWGIE